MKPPPGHQSLIASYLVGVAMCEVVFAHDPEVMYLARVITAMVVWLVAASFDRTIAVPIVEETSAADIKEEHDIPASTTDTSPESTTLPTPEASSNNSPTTNVVDETPSPRERRVEQTVEAEVKTKEEQDDLSLLLHVAKRGNGEGGELTPEQLRLCTEMKREMIERYAAAWSSAGIEKEMQFFLNEETARRYLAARGWNYKKAANQLRTTLEYRAQARPWTPPFHESPKCLRDPSALVMRVIGLDKDQRPVIYTNFAQATDRFDPDANLVHMTSLLEATYAGIIRKLFDARRVEDASQLQMVWVVDFCGFGFRDQNPRTAVVTAYAMQHYPELLHMCVLLEAPLLFQGVWNLAQLALDDRVRAKLAFVSLKTLRAKVEPRIGGTICDWILGEAEVARKDPKRKYWEPPLPHSTHDSRGTKAYLEDAEGIRLKTPAETWLERTASNRSNLL